MAIIDSRLLEPNTEADITENMNRILKLIDTHTVRLNAIEETIGDITPIVSGLTFSVKASTENIGKTVVYSLAATEGTLSDNLVYKVGTDITLPLLGETLTGWTALNYNDETGVEIEASDGDTIFIVETNDDNEAIKGCSATAVVSVAVSGLTLTSVAGTTIGTTAISVSPALGENDTYVVAKGASSSLPVVGASSTDLTTLGYAAWNGTDDIEATADEAIYIVECDSDGKAVKGGTTAAVIKTE